MDGNFIMDDKNRPLRNYDVTDWHYYDVIKTILYDYDDILTLNC